MKTVLVPIYTAPIAGGYGSRWTSDLTIRNDGDEPVPINPINMTIPSAGPMWLAPHRDTPVGAVSGQIFGQLIHAPASLIGQLQFNARVKDLSRQANSAGVEIPVVREGELRSRIVLLNVPVDARFRNALRIYDINGHATTVRLRIFQFDSDTALVDTPITLMEPQYADSAQPAQSNLVDLGGMFPAIKTATSLRIEIDGSTPTLWAMVSTTNNESQEVTIVTPN